MPVARCLIRPQPHYRSTAFHEGLRAAGFDVEPFHGKPRRGDVLVIWNRYGHYDAIARDYERAGAGVLVVENGWIGNDADGHHLFAICGHQHNGAGTWPVGEEDRWSKLNISLKPWRERGEHVLVLPQRGIGPEGVAMPAGWTASIYSRLKRWTDRPIRIREHPGKERPPLEPDLENCHAAVTWGSGAAIKAIVAGIPVFFEMPKWIGAPAAKPVVADLESPFLGDRLPMLRRLAWAQWTVNEVKTGAPFRWLLT